MNQLLRAKLHPTLCRRGTLIIIKLPSWSTDSTSYLHIITLLRGDDAVSDHISSSSSVQAPGPRPKLLSRKDLAYEKAKSLSITKCIGKIEILPSVKETYEKESQTDFVDDSVDYDRPDLLTQTPRRPSAKNMMGSTGRVGSTSKIHLSMDTLGSGSAGMAVLVKVVGSRFAKHDDCSARNRKICTTYASFF